MLSIREYRKVSSLEEAYELNQKKSNCLLGGMLWLKMQHRNVGTAIDLSALALDRIEETEEEFRIGAMVNLRQLEVHEGIDRYSSGAVKESLKHIVGVQFRNGATVGGSLFSRFGFSDVLTVLLAMDAQVELYRGGKVSLEEFVCMPPDRDILVNLIVKKVPIKMAYQSMRNTKTDFPVLTCAVSMRGESLYAAVGARPGKAVLIREPIQSPEVFASRVASKVSVGSNMRGSAEYRTHLVQVLTLRACREVCEDEDQTLA